LFFIDQKTLAQADSGWSDWRKRVLDGASKLSALLHEECCTLCEAMPKVNVKCKSSADFKMGAAAHALEKWKSANSKGTLVPIRTVVAELPC